MSLNAAERAELKASWQRMSTWERICYIWLYYKWYILLALLAVGIVASGVHRYLTQKTPLVYLGIANVALGDGLLGTLDAGFVTAQGQDPKRTEVYLYQNLYLSNNASTDNHEYAYASRLKLMATVADQQLDLVLMNREAWDMLSNGGYLLPLPDLLAPDKDLAAALAPRLCENTVILSDNSIEVELGEADEYDAETEQAVNGIDVTDLPLFAGAGVSGQVYLGVIGNTPREETVRQYLAWLVQA